MKKEDIKQIYGNPGEGFHNRVVQTLDSLEDTPTVHSGSSRRKKIIAICAVAAALGTFTITGAATSRFGLVTTRTGNYGLNVKVETSDSSEKGNQSLKINFGYMPESYSNEKATDSLFEYKKGDEYFNSYIIHANDYEIDMTNVIETSETENDGHKTLIITFKEAENTDRLFYASLKYFDEYNCLVHCNCSDYDELVKITENVTLEPSTDTKAPDDIRNSSNYSYEGAMDDYARGDSGFRDEYLAGRVKETDTGETMNLSTANYDEEPVNLTAKVISFEKHDNADGLEMDDFINLGLETTYTMFFNPDGTLKKEKTETVYEGSDENNLGTATDITFTRNFYIANIEVTAEEDIEDLHKVFRTGVCIVENNCYSDCGTEDYGSAVEIYNTNANKKLSLKKGETAVIQSGIIIEQNKEKDDLAKSTYLQISAINAQEPLYQNYMVKVSK